VVPRSSWKQAFVCAGVLPIALDSPICEGQAGRRESIWPKRENLELRGQVADGICS
jgi:hypothetical protein